MSIQLPNTQVMQVQGGRKNSLALNRNEEDMRNGMMRERKWKEQGTRGDGAWDNHGGAPREEESARAGGVGADDEGIEEHRCFAVREFLEKLRAGETLDNALKTWKRGNSDMSKKSHVALSAVEGEFSSEIGRQAETLVYFWLSSLFGGACKWISAFGAQAGAVMSADDGAGLILLFKCSTRDLVLRVRHMFPSCRFVGDEFCDAESAQIAVEVKGHVYSLDRCIVSVNEQTVMEARGAHYVIVLVSLRTKAISAMWLNPSVLIEQNRKTCSPQTLLLELC